MKKILYSLIIILLVSGCSKEKMSICKINIENKEQNYTLNGEYKIYHKNSYVTKIVKEEEYISDDNSVNIKQMLKDKYLDEYYVNNNKLTLGGIKYFYESKSAKCDI